MPPLDPEISGYIEKADRMKAAEQRKADREQVKRRPKPHFPIETESARTYRAMYPRKPTIAWWYGFGGSLILYGISWLGEFFPYDRLLASSLIIGYLVWGIIRKYLMPIVWAATNGGWRSQLPFTLNGWDELLADSRLYNKKYWRDFTITITPSVTTPELETALDATMMLFGRKVWDNYGGSDGPDARLHWKTSAFYAEGSGNNRIFGMLVELFTGSLSRIARMTDAKLTVTITPTKEYYYVKPESFSFPAIVP